MSFTSEEGNENDKLQLLAIIADNERQKQKQKEIKISKK
jgi:hypothetical protein